MESRLADSDPRATSPPPKPPGSPRISPSRSIGSDCVTPSAASSTVGEHRPLGLCARGHSICCRVPFIPGSARVSRVTPVRSKTGRGELVQKKRSPGRFRVSGGLLNPAGGARNRPRNKAVLAQKKNELNKDFARRAKFASLRFKKNNCSEGGIGR